jgi:hypothetical protein
MKRILLAALTAALLPATTALRADDLKGADRILCTAVQATGCQMDGECVADLPWNLNVPQFIEVDLKGRRLSTTRASGENRTTAIEHLRWEEGVIVLQGFEKGRAFSFVITEETGLAAVAVAREGRAAVVFGACTPMPASK